MSFTSNDPISNESLHVSEWVTADRIDLSQEVEWPAPEKPEKKKTTVTTKGPPSKKNRTDSRDVSATPDLLGSKAGNDRKPEDDVPERKLEPTQTSERANQAQQVKCERHDPEERNCRDVHDPVSPATRRDPRR